MYEALQNYIEELIISSPNDKTTLIKLFDGISIEVVPKSEETRFLPLVQENRCIPERIKLSVNITQHYKEKVNSIWKEQKKQ